MYGNNTQHTQAASDSAIFINQSNNNTVTNNTTTDPALPPPAAPVISGDTVNGLAPATVTLNGTAAANSTITVFDNSTQLGTTVANGSGAWTFTTKPLANGSQSFTATATDSVGHVSPLSSPLVVPLNVPVNLVANGNFETGDFTAWTLGGNYTSTIYGPEIFINTNSTGGGTHAAAAGAPTRCPFGRAIGRLAALKGAELNEAKKILAWEATKLCHGDKAAVEVEATAASVFEHGFSIQTISDDLASAGTGLPLIEVERFELEAGIAAFELFRRAGLASSNSEARRLIKGGGARLNNAPVVAETQMITHGDLDPQGTIKLSAGKKRHALVRVV